MTRKVSKAELKRQIEREGKRWNLTHMESVFGDVLVAEDIPCVLPLAPGVMYIERVRRDITAVSMKYPWAAILRGRRHASQRSAALQIEIQNEAYNKAIEKRKEEIFHELKLDIRKADKQIVRAYGFVDR